MAHGVDIVAAVVDDVDEAAAVDDGIEDDVVTDVDGDADDDDIPDTM